MILWKHLKVLSNNWAHLNKTTGALKIGQDPNNSVSDWVRIMIIKHLFKKASKRLWGAGGIFSALWPGDPKSKWSFQQRCTRPAELNNYPFKLSVRSNFSLWQNWWGVKVSKFQNPKKTIWLVCPPVRSSKNQLQPPLHLMVP